MGVDALERIEDRRDQHRAAIVRLDVLAGSRPGSGFSGTHWPLSRSTVPIMLRSAPRCPRSASPNCVASSPEHGAPSDPAAGRGELMLDQFART